MSALMSAGQSSPRKILIFEALQPGDMPNAVPEALIPLTGPRRAEQIADFHPRGGCRPDRRRFLEDPEHGPEVWRPIHQTLMNSLERRREAVPAPTEEHPKEAYAHADY